MEKWYLLQPSRRVLAPPSGAEKKRGDVSELSWASTCSSKLAICVIIDQSNVDHRLSTVKQREDISIYIPDKAIGEYCRRGSDPTLCLLLPTSCSKRKKKNRISLQFKKVSCDRQYGKRNPRSEFCLETIRNKTTDFIEGVCEFMNDLMFFHLIILSRLTAICLITACLYFYSIV